MRASRSQSTLIHNNKNKSTEGRSQSLSIPNSQFSNNKTTELNHESNPLELMKLFNLLERSFKELGEEAVQENIKAIAKFYGYDTVNKFLDILIDQINTRDTNDQASTNNDIWENLANICSKDSSLNEIYNMLRPFKEHIKDLLIINEVKNYLVKWHAKPIETLTEKLTRVIEHESRGFYTANGITTYRSHSGGEKVIDINGKANDKNNLPLVCRQLAHYKSMFPKHITKLSQQISQDPSLIKNYPTLYNNYYDENKLNECSTWTILFTLPEFGTTLYDRCSKMKVGDKISLIFSSSNHAMEIKLHYKAENKITINFFDPNMTNISIRATIDNINLLKKLEIRHFLPQEYIDEYFPISPKTAWFSYLDPEHQPHKHLKVMVSKGLDVKENLSIVMYLQEDKLTRKFMRYILLDDKLTSDKKIEYLIANSGGVSPMFFIALQNGYTQIVTVFSEEIAASKLDHDSKVKLLAPVSKDGISGLFIALQQGHSETVKAYIEAILNSKLEYNTEVNILSAEKEDGVSGLFMALQQGRSETVKVYTEAILTSKLEYNTKVNILSAVRKDGRSGLFIASHRGNSETVKAYIETILTSQLNNDSKVKLITAANKDGASGLFIALYRGNSETVKVYIDTILASKINNETKVKLLLAADSNGLFQTNHIPQKDRNNYLSTLTTYLENILATNLADKITSAIVPNRKLKSGNKLSAQKIVDLIYNETNEELEPKLRKVSKH